MAETTTTAQPFSVTSFTFHNRLGLFLESVHTTFKLIQSGENFSYLLAFPVEVYRREGFKMRWISI